ncbi:MAG: 50S ribosomal protein L24 [Bacilli bacterium]
MKVKVGDQVKVIAGSNKGKEGKVIKTLKKDNKVVVEGINIVKKHIKPGRTNETGGILEMEAPIHVSNVKVIEKTTKPKKEAKATKDAKEVKTEKAPKKATAKKTEKKASK